jgi:hypothetical protein
MNPKLSYRLFTLSKICLLLLFTVAVSHDVAAQGNGNGNKPLKKLIRLQPGTVEPNATGIAKIMVKTKGNPMQKFQVVGANLKSGTTYTLFVNGVQVDSDAATVETGSTEAAVEFFFVKKAKGSIGEDQKPLPTSLDPITIIRLVELRDSSGMIVLSGEFAQ